jgi:hypothetical protein
MSTPNRTKHSPRLPDCIEISWHDVAEIRPDLTADQCREVLQKALSRHDAGIGITWDVLEIHANDLFPLP